MLFRSGQASTRRDFQRLNGGRSARHLAQQLLAHERGVQDVDEEEELIRAAEEALARAMGVDEEDERLPIGLLSSTDLVHAIAEADERGPARPADEPHE